MELHKVHAKDLRKLLDEGKVSATELAGHYIDRISKLDKSLNSYITVCADQALAQAKAADEALRSGSAGALTGIPVSIKDNICTNGIRTTCASKMLESFVPPYDATVVERLNQGGGVLLGKTNMDEFSVGPASQSSYFGGVNHPTAPGHIPGGSSGGAAASVAAGLCAAALASDTGGSTCQPAAFCGVTGLKPTYGAVSRYGLIASGSSFEQIGVIAKSAGDCAMLLDAIGGHDHRDATSLHRMGSAAAKFGQDLRGRKIALPQELFGAEISPVVKAAVQKAAAWYEAQGCELMEVSLPSLRHASAVYYILAGAEFSSNMARFDGIKYGHRSSRGETYEEVIKNTRAEAFGKDVKLRILLGNLVLSGSNYEEYYQKARVLREVIKQEYAAVLGMADMLLTPTTAYTAPKIGVLESDHEAGFLSGFCTIPVNLAGLPVVSTPCGYDENGLSIGMSLVGKPMGEADILQAADAFEAQFERREGSL